MRFAMTRPPRPRRIVGIAIAALAALSLTCGGSDPALNVLLISIDTLRADHLGCYGYKRTTSPHLDSLSREGAFFRSTVSTSSWTLPANLSLLTGLSPLQHGVQNGRQRLDPARAVIPESFLNAGYRTAAFVSSPYLDARYGFSRGFETYENFWRIDPTDSGPSALAEALNQSHRDRTGPQVVAAAREWLSRNTRAPFFLFVHLWEPHSDYIPSAPYDTLFASKIHPGRFSIDGYMENPDICAGMSAEKLEYIISQYDGEIALTDNLIGRVVSAIESLGIGDRTLVVVTADHGEEFFEHGGKGHRRTLLDESILVPLIVRGPGIGPHSAGIADQVSLIDVAPTLCDAARIDRIPGMLGRSLWPLLSGASVANPDTANPQFPAEFALSALEDSTDFYFSVRTAKWKTIVSSTREEYYDLEMDSGEARPLTVDTDPRARDRIDLTKTIESRLRRIALRLHREGTAPMVIDGHLEERLRALGYVD